MDSKTCVLMMSELLLTVSAGMDQQQMTELYRTLGEIIIDNGLRSGTETTAMNHHLHRLMRKYDLDKYRKFRRNPHIDYDNDDKTPDLFLTMVEQQVGSLSEE